MASRTLRGADFTGSRFSLKPYKGIPKGHPELGWLPCCLKPTFLWCNALLCLSLGSLICAVLYGVGKDCQTLLTSENAHVLSTYAPTLIASINITVFRAVFFDAFRMLPYTRMADQNGQLSRGASASKSIGGTYFPWVFESYADDPWLKLFAEILLIAVAILTTFKSVFLGSQQTSGGWILTIHPKPACYLIGAYGAMTVFYIYVFFWTKSRSTGLKWDPAAPIDHLQLVWRTNAMSEICRLPMTPEKAYDVLRKDLRFRLGYWIRKDYHVNRSPTSSYVYGIGILDKHSKEGPHDGYCNDDGSCTCEVKARCTFDQYLYPAMSNRVFLAVCLAILALSVGLCIYIIIRGAWQSGIELNGSWLLLDPASNSQDNGTPNGYIMVAGQLIPESDSTTANILFRAVPTFIAGFFATSFIEGLDTRLRNTQCFSALATDNCISNKSLALDYSCQVSFMVPVRAFSQGHYRIALVSFVATFAPLFPVFVAGLVIFERRGPTILALLVAKPAFVIVCLYLVFLLLAAVAAWPRTMELLLRPMYSIADSVRPFAHSWLLEENTKLDHAMLQRTQEKFRAAVLLAQYRYQLGILRGTCGKSHRSIDIVGHENGDKIKRIVTAQELIDDQRAHARGRGRNWIDRLSETGGFNPASLIRRAV